MLVLSRFKHQKIVIDLRPLNLGLVDICVVEIRGDKVRLGIECDKSIAVNRKEVFEAIEYNKSKEAKP